MKGVHFDVYIGLLSFLMCVLGALLVRGVEGLYFNLNHFIVSIQYSIPNNTAIQDSCARKKNLETFF